MARCDKLLNKARASAKNFRFEDLCKLAECYGWIEGRTSGSHQMYENPLLDATEGYLMTFQNENGEAKPYQVKQLLKAIEIVETKNAEQL